MGPGFPDEIGALPRLLFKLWQQEGRLMKIRVLAALTTLAIAVAAPAAPQPPSPIPALSPAELGTALKAGVPLIVEFGGEYCIPCVQMQPVLRDLQALLGKRARVVNFWIKSYPDVARQHRIMVMPTQVIFDAKGQEVFRHMGYFPRSEFETFLKAKGLL
jgi:thioredoxin 1